MKPRLYMETTIPSLLTARPSKQIKARAQQEAAKLWWEKMSDRYSMNTDDHPAILEAYAAKETLSRQHGPQAIPFASQMRKHEAESRAKGIKFVDLSKKEPSAYAKRMRSGPLPKNYWKRKPVLPFIDPIEEETKAMAKKTSKKRPAATA